MRDLIAAAALWHTPLSPQSYCDNPDLVLDLKNLIVLFADTLQVCVCD